MLLVAEQLLEFLDRVIRSFLLGLIKLILIIKRLPVLLCVQRRRLISWYLVSIGYALRLKIQDVTSLINLGTILLLLWGLFITIFRVLHMFFHQTSTHFGRSSCFSYVTIFFFCDLNISDLIINMELEYFEWISTLHYSLPWHSRWLGFLGHLVSLSWSLNTTFHLDLLIRLDDVGLLYDRVSLEMPSLNIWVFENLRFQLFSLLMLYLYLFGLL